MNQDPGEEQMNAWHNDPNNWKWGFIYFNKEDKRIFVPKRQPLLGFTINFANRNSLAVIIGLMLLLAIIGMISSLH